MGRRGVGRRLAVAASVTLSAFGGAVLAGAATADEAEVLDDLVVEEGCVVDELLFNSCRPWFGANAGRYPQVSSDIGAQLAYFEQRTGRPMDIAHTYHGVGVNQLSATDLAYARRPDTLLFANWHLTDRWGTAVGGNATVDAQIDQMANSIKQLDDKKIFLTLAHEPENDVTEAPSCPNTGPRGSKGTPAEYRAMWANVRARFDAAEVTNVVWAVDYMSYPEHNCLIDDLWPGDELVDWVVFNGYQHSNNDVDFAKRVQEFSTFLTNQSREGHNYLSKHWGIVEWGIHNATQPNSYLFYAQAKAAVEQGRFPKVGFYLVFDNGNYDTNDFSHRVGYATNGSLDPREQAAFNLFAQSAAFTGDGSVAAPGAPGWPTGLAATRTPAGAVELSWTAPESEGMTSYEVLRDGQLVGTSPVTTFTDTTAVGSSSYVYTVRAIDDQARTGVGSSPVLVQPVVDRTAPTVPTQVTVALVGGVPEVRWAPSSDAVGVTGYEVYRDGTRVATVTGSPFTDTAASQGRSHSWRVRARDAAGNWSAQSTAATVVVPDRTAPTAPGPLRVTRSTTSARLTWTAATDNVGVTGYVVYRGTTVVARPAASARSYNVTGLRRGTRYTFSVAARDAAGNIGPSRSVTG